jgi:hypothetical protein
MGRPGPRRKSWAAPRKRRRRANPPERLWGWVLFAVLMTGWITQSIGPGALLVLSGVVTLYFLFGAPVWCGARTRENTYCRNNASGLLKGCGLRQHRWQKLKMTFVPQKWRELNEGLWVDNRQSLHTLAQLATVVAGLSGAIALLR